MSINLTDEIEVKTEKGKLGAAKQIFLEGDTQTVENEIQNINSRHSALNKKHESLSKTVQGISATGGASTAINVTYNNNASGLNAENAQDAIDELVTLLKAEFSYKGIAKPTTNPGVPDSNVFYIAGEGSYPNFGNQVVKVGQIAVLKWDGSWHKEVLETGIGGGNMILDWNTDVVTTRKQVVTKMRKAGIQISYKDPSKGWINEQYIGTIFTDTEWSKDYNWTSISNSTIAVYTAETSYSEKGKNCYFRRPNVGNTFSYENAEEHNSLCIVEIPVQSGTTLTDVHIYGIGYANSCIVCGLDLKVKKVIPYPITQDIVFDEEGIAFFNMYKNLDHFTIRNPGIISAIDNALLGIISSVNKITVNLSQFNLSPGSLFGYKLYNKYFRKKKVGTTFSFETSTEIYTDNNLDMFIMPVIPGVILSDVHIQGIGHANSYIIVDRNMKIIKSVDYPITEDITFDVEGVAIFNMGYKDYFKIVNPYTITMALTKWLVDINISEASKFSEINNNSFNAFSGFAPFSKIIFIGDSVTEGDISDLSSATYESVRKSLSYPAKVEQLYGVKAINLGHSGTSISGWLNHHYSEFVSNKENADCCVIELGLNSSNYPNTENGIDGQIQSDVAQYGDDYNSYNTASSIGCYCKLIKKIQNDAPNIIIFVVASFGFSHLFTYATQKIASQTGVIFLDASSYSPDGIDKVHFTAPGYAKKASIISYLIGSLPDTQRRIISSKLRILHAN